MKGLDPEEREVLDAILRYDARATERLSREAILRCAARQLYVMTYGECPDCGESHEMPALTAEGKTAVACDDAMRTLEV